MAEPSRATAVLDASAILALLWDEPGADVVIARLDGAAMSVANVAEVVVKHVDHGIAATGIAHDLEALGIRIEPVAIEEAEAHGALRRLDLTAGQPTLSLGDRCCLALAQRLVVPAITADRSWAELGLDVPVILVR